MLGAGAPFLLGAVQDRAWPLREAMAGFIACASALAVRWSGAARRALRLTTECVGVGLPSFREPEPSQGPRATDRLKVKSIG